MKELKKMLLLLTVAMVSMMTLAVSCDEPIPEPEPEPVVKDYNFDLFVCAEFKIDLIGVLDQFLHGFKADEIGKIAAHVCGEGKFSVRKSPRAGKARRDRAVLAIHTNAGLAFGASALFDSRTFFNKSDLFFAALSDKFDRRKNACRTCSDNQNIRFHTSLPIGDFPPT